MTRILLAVYFIIIGAIQLFKLTVDPVFLGILALVLGILLLVEPYVGTAIARRPVA